MAEGERKSRSGRIIGMLVLVLAGIGAYGAVALNAIRHAHTTADEVAYLIRSWWYVSGEVSPYSAADATWAMPLYYYVLGWWQQIAGLGHYPGRLLSAALGLAAAAILFAITRRLTGNLLAAGAAAFLFLATPTVAHAFALATPTALLAVLHLAAMWIIVLALGRPQPVLTVVFAVLCVAIYFTRQNLILGIIILIPLYLLAIGRDRRFHALILGGVIAAGATAVLLVFPDRLAGLALRLPYLTLTFARWGLLPADFGLIEQGTVAPLLPEDLFSLARFSELRDTWLLPFAGTIALAALLFVVTGRNLRVLWLAPLYFFGLSAAHVIAARPFCRGCMLDYTPMFIGAGVLAAALALAALATRMKGKIPAPAVIMGGALAAAALNTFAPALAGREQYRAWPAPQLAQPLPQTELEEIALFSRWLATVTSAPEPLVVIHDMPALSYAVFGAGKRFPVQSIAPDASRRVIKPRLVGPTREAIQGAIEAQSLWTDDTLRRWLARDYELVLFQARNDIDQSAIVRELEQRFSTVASQRFRGRTVTLYKRSNAP
jgi:hypothetical protein